MELKSKEEKVDVEEKDQEKSNGTVWLENKSFRIVLVSIFTALAVVLGYMLVFIPNMSCLL